MLKRIAKNFVRHTISKLDYPLVVNSYGRSGSTVLTKGIIQSSVTLNNESIKNLAYRAITQTSWDLNVTNFKNGAVYKSHDYPPSDYSNKQVKMIYTFADPIDVVISLLRLFDEKGEEWMKQHYQHLGVNYKNTFDQIINEDQLQLEKHLDTWLNESKVPIAFIRYETMWDHQDEISNYLGFSLKLPEYRERKADKNKETEKIKSIRKTYDGLRTKILSLDSFFIKNG